MEEIKNAQIRFEIRLNQTATNQVSRQAYDTLYEYDDISQTDSFYLWITKLLDLRPNERYCDVSCGKAQIATLAAKAGVQAFGLDISHHALKLANQQPQPENIRLVTGNSQELPFKSKSFDVVSNIGSIEHYVDMEAAIREMSRVMKPTGRALILVPNTYSLLHNILLAYKKGYSVVDAQPIQRYAARSEWQKLLEENGLVVQKTHKYEIERPRTREDWQAYFRHPKKLIRLAATPFVPLNLCFCFVFVCGKK